MTAEGFATAAQVIPILALVVAIEGRAAPRQHVRTIFGLGRPAANETHSPSLIKLIAWIWAIGVAVVLGPAVFAEAVAIAAVMGAEVGEAGATLVIVGLWTLGVPAAIALALIMWDWLMRLTTEPDN